MSVSYKKDGDTLHISMTPPELSSNIKIVVLEYPAVNNGTLSNVYYDVGQLYLSELRDNEKLNPNPLSESIEEDKCHWVDKK